MNSERNIDDELTQMWNRVTNKVTTTTTRVKAIVRGVVDKRFSDLEEQTGDNTNAIAAIKRGILSIAGAFGKKN